MVLFQSVDEHFTLFSVTDVFAFAEKDFRIDNNHTSVCSSLASSRKLLAGIKRKRPPLHYTNTPSIKDIYYIIDMHVKLVPTVDFISTCRNHVEWLFSKDYCIHSSQK